MQGKRCYENIEDWCYEHDEAGRRTEKVKDFILDKPMRSETNWKHGSKVEVVPGSEKAVSGPHPQKAGADEVDQMETAVWTQSRGMAVAKQSTGKLPTFMDHFNGIIPPQDIVTSTRNSRHGLMQSLLDEVAEDVKNANIPQFASFVWCIFETIAEVPNCRQAPKDAREARLKELGRDTQELCTCNRVVKGRHKDGKDRTLESVCEGKAFRSRGWKPYVDFVSTFKRNTPGTWLLQHECREGRDDNNYIQDWSLDEYGLRHYEPRPEYGPIYQGIDWGGTNPYCALWIQYLTVNIEAYDFLYSPIILSANTYVAFREVYLANIDTSKLAKHVKTVEDAYREQYGKRWKVDGRFMDPQGKGDRLYFARKGMPGTWPVQTRKKEQMINVVQNVVMDDRFAVDPDGCPMFVEEIEEWQTDPNTGKEIDERNHAMASWRYCIANAEMIHAKDRPTAGGRVVTTEKSNNNGKQYLRSDEDIHDFAIRQNRRKKVGPISLSTRGSTHPVDQFDLKR